MRNAGIAAFIILACRLATIGGQVQRKPPTPIIVPPGLEKWPPEPTPKPKTKPKPPGPWAEELRQKLMIQVIFELKDDTITEACGKLTKITECPIVVDPALASDTRRLSLHRVTYMTAGNMLRWICLFWNATYVFRDGAVLVTPGLEKWPPKPEPKPKPPGPWADDLREKLRKKITFEVKDATLIEACQKFARLAHFPIVVDPALASVSSKLTLPKVNLDAEHMLRWLCRFWGATYVLRDGTIFVTRRGAGPKIVLERYDIADLLLPPLPPATEKPDGDAAKMHRQWEAACLRARCGWGWPYYIRAIIAPWSWGRHHDVGITTASYRKGRLVVVHTKPMHDAVQTLLADFRKNRNRQIHVLARFLQLPGDALDELKLDYQQPGPAYAYGRLPRRTPSDPARDGKGRQLPSGLTELPVPRHAPLATHEASRFLSAVIKERKGTLLLAPRLTCFNGQYAYIEPAVNRGYIRRDEEEEKLPFPKGWRIDVQPFLTPDGKHITLVFDSPLLVPPGAQLVSRGRAGKFPVLRSDCRTITIPDGGTILFHYPPDAFAEHVAPKEQAKDAPRQSLVILLTAESIRDIFKEE